MPDTKQEFDPVAYIENAFLDTNGAVSNGKKPTATIESMAEEVRAAREARRRRRDGNGLDDNGDPRRPGLSAPRPRRRKQSVRLNAIDPELRELWEAVPRNIEFLSNNFDDDVTSNYYRGDFKESRQELIRRLLDPELTLEEVSRLLGVCPATVRRYTNRNWLKHHRTKGGQRRFRLTNVVRFVEDHGRIYDEQ